MISKDKQYRTRDGREVRIYATDGADEAQCVHGAVKNYYGWAVTVWGKDGQCIYGAGSSGTSSPAHDLIEVKPRIQRTVWMNVYEREDDVYGYISKERADNSAAPDRILCVKVEIDCEEGEGL
jgi:hypothetical protein